MIRQLPITHGSYCVAKKVLLREYGNTNYTSKALYHKLQDLPTYSENLTDLSKFVDETEQILLHMSQTGYVDILDVLVTTEQKVPVW